jgi:hypothetical protein
MIRTSGFSNLNARVALERLRGGITSPILEEPGNAASSRMKMGPRQKSRPGAERFHPGG